MVKKRERERALADCSARAQVAPEPPNSCSASAGLAARPRGPQGPRRLLPPRTFALLPATHISRSSVPLLLGGDAEMPWLLPSPAKGATLSPGVPQACLLGPDRDLGAPGVNPPPLPLHRLYCRVCQKCFF